MINQKLLNLYAYFAGNPNYNEEFYPFNQFFPPGYDHDIESNKDTAENKQKDGKEFKEFEEFKKEHEEEDDEEEVDEKPFRRKKRKQNTLQPHDYASSQYGYISTEGLNSMPQADYAGTIVDDVGPIFNPWNTIYQSASSYEYMSIQKIANSIPIKNRKHICQIIISIFADALGGEGWDDNRLPKIVESWISWPSSWEDQVIDVYKEVDDLINEGFDPRYLLDTFE